MSFHLYVNVKRMIPYGALIFGSLLVLTGLAFIAMYVLKAIVARSSEPDQSLLFWYLPLLFLGLSGIGIGFAISAIGINRLRKHRLQLFHKISKR